MNDTLEIVNQQGETRIKLTTDDEGGRLVLVGADGDTTITLRFERAPEGKLFGVVQGL